MSSSEYIIDIDKAFLDRLERSTIELNKSVTAAKALTAEFISMTANAHTMEERIKAFAGALGNVSKGDIIGADKVSEDGKQIIDTLNIVRGNIAQIKGDYAEFKKTLTKSQQRKLAITNKSDLEDIDKLNVAIGKLKERLGSKGEDGKKLSLVDARRLATELDIYKRAAAELTDSDDKIVRRKVKQINDTVKAVEMELKKEKAMWDAYLKERRRIEAEAQEVEKARYQSTLVSLHNRQVAEDNANENRWKKQEDAIKKQNDIRQKEADAEEQRYKDELMRLRNRQALEKEDANATINERRQRAKDDAGQQWYKQQAEKARQARQMEVAAAEEADRKINESGKVRAQNAIDQYNRETNAARESYIKRQKMYEDLFSAPNSFSTTEIIDSAEEANSINELEEAIKRLKERQRDINPNTNEGRKEMALLDKSIISTQRRLDELTGYQSRVKRGFLGMADTAGQMRSAVASALSFAAIKGYAGNLVRVYGTFEMTRKSLAVLLKTEDRAVMTFNKITRLAVKSPFTIQQLSDATRQMAAYRIESEKLYEKTKMLADISAGLGVEMNRLILAYGQVKAANFLRATELRQFSEAGIDMLGQLAAYFSELEGVEVTAADTFDRISKRLVLFEDVDAVLTRVTSRGGTFYKMQEEQAKTVAGRISNIKDEIQMAFDDIGKSNHDTIMGLLSAVKFIVNNLSDILRIAVQLAKVWLSVSAGVLVFKTLNRVVTGARAAMIGFRRIMASVQASTTGGIKAINIFKATLRGLPSILGMAVGALAFLASCFFDFSSSIDDTINEESKLSEQTDNLKQSLTELADTYEAEAKKMTGYMDTIIATTKAINNLNAEDNKSIEQHQRIANLIDERRVALAELAGLSAEMASVVAAALAGGNEAEITALIDKFEKQLAGRGIITRNIAEALGGEKGEDVVAYLKSQTVSTRDIAVGEVSRSDVPEFVKTTDFWKDISEGGKEAAKQMETFSEALSYLKQVMDEGNFLDKVKGKPSPSGAYDKDLKLWNAMAQMVNLGLADKDMYRAHLNSQNWYDTSRREFARHLYDGVLLPILGSSLGETALAWQARKGGAPAEWKKIEMDAIATANASIGVQEAMKKAVDIDALKNLTIKQIFEALAKEEFVNDIEAENAAKNVQYAFQKAVADNIGKYEWPNQELAEGAMKTIVEQAGGVYNKNLTEPLKDWMVRYNALFESQITGAGLTLGSVANIIGNVKNAATKDTDVISQLSDALKEQQGIVTEYELNKGAGMYDEKQYNVAVKMVKIIPDLQKFFGVVDKSSIKSGDKALKSITDVHKAFLDLRKDMEAPDAVVGSWEQYGDSLGIALKDFGLSLEDFKTKFGDLSSEDSVKKALTWLRDQFVKGSDEYYKIQREIDGLDQTDRVRSIQKQREAASREIEEAFSGFELSIELDKMQIPKDFAQDFFGISLHDIPGIREFIKARKDIFSGEDGEKEYLRFMKRLDDLETKQQQEHLKKYIEYTKKAIGERAQILLKGHQELMEIEKAFQITNTLALKRGLITKEQKKLIDEKGWSIGSMTVDKMTEVGLTQQQIEAIARLAEALGEQRSAAIEESNKRTEKALNKKDWEALKSTDTFIQMFNDLESMSEASLRNMIATLNEYKQQWADMPVSDVKEMINKINELEMALLSLQKPKESRAAIREAMGEIKGITSKENAQATQLAAEEEILRLEKEKSLVEEIEALKQRGFDEESLKLELSNRGVVLADEQERILEAQSSSYDSQISDEREKVNNATKYLSLLKLLLKTYDEQADRINKTKKLTDKLFDGWDAINSLFEDDALTNGLSELSRGVTDNVFAAVDFVNQFKKAKEAIDTAGDAAEIFGLQMNAAMGVVGLIVTAVQIFAKVMKFTIEQHDAALQSRIDDELKNIKELQRSYEALEKAIERAYTTAELGSKSRDAISNLEDQKRATEQMISLEEQKKKSDQDTIDEWKDNIADMEAQIEELKENTFSKLTDGILDDVLSVTRSFVDAWYDAFKEAGSGMKGLEESFNEMLLNMLKQQASMQLITPYLNKWKEWLKMYVNADDSELTKEEAKAWAEKVKGTLPEINNLLEGFFDGVDSILATGGELSDLEKGIQGMTEDQAEVLAAYWNSCRFMLSNIDTTLATLAKSSLQSVDDSNPIIAELRAQTKVMTDIKNILSSVIGFGSSIPSSYIRVLA